MAEDSTRQGHLEIDDMLRPSPNHGTQRLPNDDDDDEVRSARRHRGRVVIERRWRSKQVTS